MLVSGGKTAWFAILAAFVSLLGGCVSHDQVHLTNPSPVRVHCHADFVAAIDPECHGYHPTCWKPWSCNCPPCPPPTVGVAPPAGEYFEMVPEDIRTPSEMTLPSEELLPGTPSDLRILPQQPPRLNDGEIPPNDDAIPPQSPLDDPKNNADESLSPSEASYYE